MWFGVWNGEMAPQSKGLWGVLQKAFGRLRAANPFSVTGDALQELARRCGGQRLTGSVHLVHAQVVVGDEVVGAELLDHLGGREGEAGRPGFTKVVGKRRASGN